MTLFRVIVGGAGVLARVVDALVLWGVRTGWQRCAVARGNGSAFEGLCQTCQILELFLVLAFDTVEDGIEDVVHGSHGSELWLGTLLIDTGTDKDRVPGLFGFFVELVRSTNIGLGSVADKVDSVWWSVDSMCVFPPLL